MPDSPPIFINYRRTKTRDKAQILHLILEKEFGTGVSFLDNESIDPGMSWQAVLQQAVQQCDVLLALIHADWHKDQDESGEKLLTQPQDWIRQEIATALQANKLVIPVLVDQAYLRPDGVDVERSNPPKKKWLPEDLHQLFEEKQLFRLRFDNLTAEKLNGFLAHLKSHLPAP